MIYRITLLFCLSLFLNYSQAQTSLNSDYKILELYDNLDKLNNDHERIYSLNIYAQQWIETLKQPDFSITPIDNHSMKMITTSDHFLTLYYIIPKFDSQQKRIDLFAVYNKNNKRTVLHFKEKPSILSQTKDTPNLDISFQFTQNQNDSIITYDLICNNSKDQLIIDKITDFYLKCLFEEMALSQSIEEKKILNDEILTRLQPLWKDNAMFKNPFSGYNRMSTLISEDEMVKICTWNIENSDATHSFYGAVITKNEFDSINVYPLIDQTSSIKTPDRQTLTTKKWYGAIYYDIIQTKFKQQNYYTLLGLKGNNEFTKIKLLEVMTIQPNGEPKFGSSILAKGPGFMPRLIFEYSSGTNMMLKYDSNYKMIVADNLVPSEPLFKDVYRFYGPDFSYNGYKFEKGKWMIYQEIDLRNPQSPKDLVKPIKTKEKSEKTKQ